MQAGHRCVATITIAEFEQNVALGLFDRKHRTNRSAALGNDRIKNPVATDAHPSGTIDDLTIEEQGSMTGVMGCCNSPDDRRVGIGVIQSADEVINRSATGIDEQQQRSAVGWVHADPVLPVLNRSIKVRERAGVQLKRLQLSSGEI